MRSIETNGPNVLTWGRFPSEQTRTTKRRPMYILRKICEIHFPAPELKNSNALFCSDVAEETN